MALLPSWLRVVLVVVVIALATRRSLQQAGRGDVGLVDMNAEAHLAGKLHSVTLESSSFTDSSTGLLSAHSDRPAGGRRREAEPVMRLQHASSGRPIRTGGLVKPDVPGHFEGMEASGSLDGADDRGREVGFERRSRNEGLASSLKLTGRELPESMLRAGTSMRRWKQRGAEPDKMMHAFTNADVGIDTHLHDLSDEGPRRGGGSGVARRREASKGVNRRRIRMNQRRSANGGADGSAQLADQRDLAPTEETGGEFERDHAEVQGDLSHSTRSLLTDLDSSVLSNRAIRQLYVWQRAGVLDVLKLSPLGEVFRFNRSLDRKAELSRLSNGSSQSPTLDCRARDAAGFERIGSWEENVSALFLYLLPDEQTASQTARWMAALPSPSGMKDSHLPRAIDETFNHGESSIANLTVEVFCRRRGADGRREYLLPAEIGNDASATILHDGVLCKPLSGGPLEEGLDDSRAPRSFQSVALSSKEGTASQQVVQSTAHLVQLWPLASFSGWARSASEMIPELRIASGKTAAKVLGAGAMGKKLSAKSSGSVLEAVDGVGAETEARPAALLMAEKERIAENGGTFGAQPSFAAHHAVRASENGAMLSASVGSPGSAESAGKDEDAGNSASARSAGGLLAGTKYLEPFGPWSVGTAAPVLLPFSFWVHEAEGVDWRWLLQCDPAWDEGLTSQNAAEVWALAQLLAHPNRTATWQRAQVIVLPLLPLTSLRAGVCMGLTHPQRLHRAAAALRAHPAWQRHHAHDHVILFNHWDAWTALGARGSFTHKTLMNVTLGWYETNAAAWGSANHRHVGKCQVVMPYVENAVCAAKSEAALLAIARNSSLFFAGAVDDFDTGIDCPNVAKHAKAVRRALLNASKLLPGSVVRATEHNLRTCRGNHQCEKEMKSTAALEMAGARFCAIAAGDTPSTSRLYDAIACLCIPIILVDNLELPFLATSPWLFNGVGLRIQADEFLAAPARTLLKATSRQDWRQLQRQLIPARRALMYRSFSSSVAARSLNEAWATCLRDNQTHARHFTIVAKC